MALEKEKSMGVVDGRGWFIYPSFLQNSAPRWPLCIVFWEIFCGVLGVFMGEGRGGEVGWVGLVGGVFYCGRGGEGFWCFM